MRSRHTSIAVTTCSSGSSASAATGWGPLTMTSCAPVAGRALNSSELPLARDVAVSSGRRASPPSESPSGRRSAAASAGNRFGTTRTLQPGPLGSLFGERSAYSSGGVSRSLPSAKGSSAGAIGAGRRAAMDMCGSPPGRRERSPAMIVLCPLSGSILSSVTSRSSAQRVAFDVLFELRLAGVGALVDVLAAAAVVEDGHRREAGVRDRPAGLTALVLVARIAQRVGAQVGKPVATPALPAVDADERDPLAQRKGHALEGAELAVAWHTPGGPLVDHDGLPVQPSQACSHGCQ